MAEKELMKLTVRVKKQEDKTRIEQLTEYLNNKSSAVISQSQALVFAASQHIQLQKINSNLLDKVHKLEDELKKRDQAIESYFRSKDTLESLRKRNQAIEGYVRSEETLESFRKSK